MLDEEEFKRVVGTPTGSSLKFQQKAALDEYEKITGYRETNPNAVWHHRISIYGPPCRKCGKPLRTPQASFCAACGFSTST
jgi:uncharacterized OB-fold protein